MLIPNISLLGSVVYFFEYSLISVQMQGVLTIKIFEKTLKYPITRSSFYKLGDLLNMIQVDVLQIVGFFSACIQSIALPLFLIYGVYVNFQMIGGKGIVGTFAAIF